MKRNHLLHPRPKLKLSFFAQRGAVLLRHPLFQFLTIAGNGFVVVTALVFYFIERGVNSKLSGFLDALWWSVATVTTVGYGDVSPVTTLGKIAGMVLMIFGTALFSSFTALFASILLEPEITEVEEEIQQLQNTVQGQTTERKSKVSSRL